METNHVLTVTLLMKTRKMKESGLWEQPGCRLFHRDKCCSRGSGLGYLGSLTAEGSSACALRVRS